MDNIPLVLVAASDADIPAIVALMNRAYRPRQSGAWSIETGYIDGDRTSETILREDIAANPAAHLLVWRLASGHLQGCVWLQPLQGDTWYLGSLAVDPDAQNAGLGRQLLTASENWAQSHGAHRIKITVVNVRDTLIAWYQRRGYKLTGETEPFPYDDARFGVPKRPDLCFTVLRKQLTQ
jgi:GNAT superfamily N-acetyltransferase